MINVDSRAYTRRQFLGKVSTVWIAGTGIAMAQSKPDDTAVTKDIAQIDLSGIVDMHVHGNTRRRNYGQNLTAYETARAMAEHGIKAWVDKEKRGYTWATAEILRRAVPGTLTLGSLVLDKTIGGINPSAVITALSGAGIYAGGDARVIWMPSSTEQIDRDVFLTDGNGNLLPNVLEVLRMIAQHNVVLGSGHLPFKHLIKIIPEARRLGVEKIMITHSDRLSLDEQKDLCKYGVYFDRCIGDWPWWVKKDFKELKSNPALFKLLVRELVGRMRAVGMERNLITTDWGPHTFWDSPPVAMKPYLWALMQNGVSANEIDMMARSTPASLVKV